MSRIEIPTSAVSVSEGLVAQHNLIEIADRWPDLRARLRPANVADLGGGGASVPKSKPPIDLYISDLMFEIETEAQSLAHVLMDETDWEPTTSAMPGLLREVAERYGHFTTGDDRTALAFIDWAEDYQHRVTKALERPVAPSYIGPCSQALGEDGPECGGDVYAKEGHTYGTCRECLHKWDLADQREWLEERLEERLMSQSEIVSALMVLGTPKPPKTVQSWAQRKQLPEVAPGMYRLADAKVLAERGRGRPRVALLQ